MEREYLDTVLESVTNTTREEKMSNKYGVTSTVTCLTSVKWKKRYRRYRAGRTRLYMCMVSLMLFVLLSVVCMAFLFKNSFYFHPREYELNKGDMRVLQVSTFLCESIVIKKANFNRRIMVVSSVKRYEATSRSMVSDVALLRRDSYWYRSFYLLKGSIVRMRLFSHHTVSVYWLKGRTTLNKWTRQMSSVLKRSSGSKTEKYTETRMEDTLKVTDDSNYYLGVASIAGDTTYSEVHVNLTLSRMVYDIRSYLTFCNASAGQSCQVNLRFNSNDTAIIEVEDNTTDMDPRDIWTIWYCQPRIWIYLAIFGGTFLLSIFLLFLIYLCIMSKVNKKIQKKSQVPSRTESFNMRAVVLQSINTTEGHSGDIICENYEDPLPQRLITASNHIEHHSLEEHDVDETVTDNGFTTALVTSFSGIDENANSELLQTTPSPRWSTFLQDPDYEYEECVTNFHEASTNSSASASNSNVYNNEEETYFGNELVNRLNMLETEKSIVYDGPEETDIDDFNESELEPFINASNNMNTEDDTSNMLFEDDQREVIRRSRELRREQRWQPRLSMVTEV